MAPKSKPNLPDDWDFEDRTIEWFEKWRNSSRTDNWDDLQWEYMFDTAMVHSMVQCGDTTMLSELDKRLRFLGLTFEEQQEEVKAKKTTTTLSVIRGNRDAKAKKAKAGRAAS